jgi:uncharacterized peroxidase-related enzyme
LQSPNGKSREIVTLEALIMQRIPTVEIGDAPKDSQPILEQINKQFGRVPNIFASVAHSPAALKSLMGMFGSLDGGKLAGKAHEAIALRVGEVHGCEYCVSAHTAKAKMVGVTDDEAIAFRRGETNDPRLSAVLSLATSIIEKRGQVSDAELQAARGAGLSDEEVLETLAIVVLNTFTNYLNAIVKTKVDFPRAPAID